MSLLKRLSRYTRDAIAIHSQSGFVGLYYTVQIARRQRRLNRIKTLIERENDLHRQSKELLSQELLQAIDEQQAAIVSAALYFRQLGMSIKVQP